MFNATRNVTAFIIGTAISACLCTGNYFVALWVIVLSVLIAWEMRTK